MHQLALAWQEQKGNCNAAVFSKVRWLSSRLLQKGAAYRGTRLATVLVAFQLGLYHKVESQAQFKTIKSCPRCEHTLTLVQSVFSRGPQACNVVRHHCTVGIAIQWWKDHSVMNNSFGFVGCMHSCVCVCVCLGKRERVCVCPTHRTVHVSTTDKLDLYLIVVFSD